MSSKFEAAATSQYMLSIPRNVEEITSFWLSEVLQLAGGFETCSVKRVTARVAPKWHIAQTAFLNVDYDAGADTDLPRHLFVTQVLEFVFPCFTGYL